MVVAEVEEEVVGVEEKAVVVAEMVLICEYVDHT